jgi:hypothetical protein
MDIEVIWVSGEEKYFCKWGWTSHFGKHEVICPSGSHIACLTLATPPHAAFAMIVSHPLSCAHLGRRLCPRYLFVGGVKVLLKSDESVANERHAAELRRGVVDGVIF